ncbi:MAG: YdeI/OmpD-associated family protein [Deltaproteobacteria bacterium]|nr:YdeI/OmpD-associated family protein [Deltaproteobacteria bacterium]
MSGKNKIDEYIEMFPEHVQAILRKIRKIITKVVPDGEESIVYKIPTFKLGGNNLLHFAAYSRHIGFYPTPSGIEKFRKDLKPYKMSKGSVQFPLSDPIPYDLIKKITEFRANELSQIKMKQTKREVKNLPDPVHSLPEDFAKELRATLAVRKAWTSLTPLDRNEWICWVISAKKSETRQKRIKIALEKLTEGSKRPCCWPGCPHRRPAAAKWFRKKSD